MNPLGLIGAGISLGVAVSWMGKGARARSNMILGFILGMICLIAGLMG